MNNRPRIGIIIGSTRAARFADRPTEWIRRLAEERDDLEVEIVDLRDYPLPFYDESITDNGAPAGAKWAAKMAELDGYLFVTAEYNHSIPGVLKNALDHAHAEYNRKPAAFVGYGGVGAARAVEQLRLILAELQIATLKHAVHINANEFVPLMKNEKDFSDFPYLGDAAKTMLDQLAWWAGALKVARAA
ncbi:NAD(P)H-dependent FMN reductase [Devosia crocina]|uniref:NAD(P)H-dependent FMN reductase n=1 Tax=Devosia crocina TaxID=429728 RepID=A0A1I7N7A0_9HYPH|nr:NAD(P)H-dependent oxidoreductase [Devosia crocina]SFV30446.1 NAD(P)H-dependent FMN reductase [Devosia crocina]